MTRAHLAYAAKQIRHFRVTYERSYSYGLGVGRLRGGHRELSCQILVGVVDSLCSGVLGRRDTTVADFVEKAESLARQNRGRLPAVGTCPASGRHEARASQERPPGNSGPVERRNA
jgi:hypothetical protein